MPHSPQTVPPDAMPASYDTGDSFGRMANSLHATGAAAVIDHELLAHSRGPTYPPVIGNPGACFDWTSRHEILGQQQKFVDSQELDGLCTTYESAVFATEPPNCITLSDECLLQLPFIVALGLMAYWNAPLYKLRGQEKNRNIIGVLQSWIAMSLNEIWLTPDITLYQIRALLLATLYFQFQLENDEATAYFNMAKAKRQQYIEARGGLSQVVNGDLQGRDPDFARINLAFFNLTFPNRLFGQHFSLYPLDPDDFIWKSSFDCRVFPVLSKSEECFSFRRNALALWSPEMANESPSVLLYDRFMQGLQELKMPECLEPMAKYPYAHLRLCCVQSLSDACLPLLNVYEKSHNSHPGAAKEIDRYLAMLVATSHDRLGKFEVLAVCLQNDLAPLSCTYHGKPPQVDSLGPPRNPYRRVAFPPSYEPNMKEGRPARPSSAPRAMRHAAKSTRARNGCRIRNGYAITKAMHDDEKKWNKRSVDDSTLRRYLSWENDCSGCLKLEFALFEMIANDRLHPKVHGVFWSSLKNMLVLQKMFSNVSNAPPMKSVEALETASIEAALSWGGYKGSLKEAPIGVRWILPEWNDSLGVDLVEQAIHRWKNLVEKLKIEPLFRSFGIRSMAAMWCMSPTDDGKIKSKYRKRKPR
ncbi:hypothetical protein FDECE_16697 [Fusarium decemcellulare]|nr:hypothetical protein FDECE_16697 [Fusarium decemcellulare]